MKRINFFISALLAVLILNGCYRDKGNYDYRDLDAIVIDTSVNNILAEYAIYQYDTLSIQPKILYNGVEVKSEQDVIGKLDFTWSIFQGTVGGTVYTRDTLSRKSSLKAEIAKPAGKWIVHLAVKDLSTNVETYMRFNVNVSDNLSDGWMVLYEKDGNTDVGLIVDDRTKKGVIAPRLFMDLISGANGAPLDGKPRNILHSIAPLASAEVLISSEKNMVGVDRSSFEITFQFEDLFWSAPAVKSVAGLTGNSLRKEVVVNDNKIHIANYISSGTFRINRFGAPANGTYGELDTWVPNYFGSSFDAVVYDKTNRRFLQVAANAVNVTRFPEQLPTTQFNVDEVGLDMKAYDWGLTNYQYNIMGDGTNTYLMVTNFMGTANNVGLQKINMTSSPGVQNITTMAAASAGQYVLYGAGASVYLFLYNSGQNAQSIWTAPAGEEVSCVRIQKFYYPQIQLAVMPNVNLVVYFATWNSATQSGKVYSYLIDPSSGNIDKASERITEGYGKVKDMSYKWNL